METIKPMQQPSHLSEAPRCGARTRAGLPCMSPAVKDKKRCRMHGGKSTGAPKGNRNAWKHGDRSAEAEQMQKIVHRAGRVMKMVTRVKQGKQLRSGDHDLLIELMVEHGHLPSNYDEG